MRRLTLFVALALVALAARGVAQCPAANFNLGSACLPAPAWTLHTAMLEYAPKCTVEVVYCERWVCAGQPAGPNGPRHQISLSTFRTVPNPAEAPNDCPMPFNPNSPTLKNDMDAFIGGLVRMLYEQWAFNPQTPVMPCGTDPTVYLEVITTGCVSQGTWSGTCDFADQIPSVTVPVGGWSLKFCGSGGVNCCRTYKLCDDPNPPHARLLTVVGKVLRDNSGAIVTPTPAQRSTICNGTVPGAFPAWNAASGEGNLSAQIYPITTTAENATASFGCDLICD